MGKAQQPGIGAIKVWLIIFAALWLASTVFLVVLYTGQEELRSENTRLRAAKARLITAEEENALIRHLVDGGPTAVGLLEKARSRTAELATGDPTHDAATVRANRDEILLTIRDDGFVSQAEDFEDISLHEALTMLYQEFKEDKALRRAAEERAAELETEVDNLVQANAEQKTDFDRRAKELSDHVVEIEADRASYRTERDEAFANVESEFDARRAQTDADLTRERQRRNQAEQRLVDMQERVEELQNKFGELMIGPEAFATARQPDGKILAAIPGDEIVYIDLGKKDRLALGLRFAVYSAEMGIPADGHAKAQIEVVSISDSSAECKVVHVVGSEVVLDGDLIANPIYDPTRPPSFVVVGEFDLNRDGIPDPAGAAAIESMISDWGGVVATELTALTDFVVLGAAPLRPVTVSDPTPEQARQAEAMGRLRDSYMDTIETARSLSVPAMTQAVFLRFLGYSAS